MTFHNHLHQADESDKEFINLRYVIAIGIFGMVFSFIGNIIQTYEMYPLFLHTCTEEDESPSCSILIPASFMFSVFSDLCLVIYGILMMDMIIIGYAGLNTLVIVMVMITIHKDHQKRMTV